MDTNRNMKPSANAVSGLPAKRENSRLQPNFSQRMMLSEAIQAVNAIVNCYPNGGKSAGDGYVGAMAAVLADYPLSIAMKCADPRGGIASTSKFLPAVAELVAWLERELDRAAPRRAYPLFPTDPVVDRSGRLTYAELLAKYGDGEGGWGIDVPERKRWQPPTAAELEAMVGTDAWQKIKNQPRSSRSPAG